jgi:hypothetical protein
MHSPSHRAICRLGSSPKRNGSSSSFSIRSLLQHRVGHPADQVGRHRDAIQLFQMRLDQRRSLPSLMFLFYSPPVSPPSRTWKSEFTGLPTARTTLASRFRRTAMCHACRRTAEVDLANVVEQGLGDVPLIHLRLRCCNCRSRLCDAVVSGSHLSGL